MLKERLSKDYEDGVNSFLRYALENAMDPKKIHFPCQKCSNLHKWDIVEIRSHLICNGVDETYKHGFGMEKKVKVVSFQQGFKGEKIHHKIIILMTLWWIW